MLPKRDINAGFECPLSPAFPAAARWLHFSRVCLAHGHACGSRSSVHIFKDRISARAQISEAIRKSLVLFSLFTVRRSSLERSIRLERCDRENNFSDDSCFEWIERKADNTQLSRTRLRVRHKSIYTYIFLYICAHVSLYREISTWNPISL